MRPSRLTAASRGSASDSPPVSPPTRTSTKVEAYEAFAAERGHTVTELAIGWLLAQPSVTSVIAGATKPEQIAANTASWTLSPAEAATVAGLGS